MNQYQRALHIDLKISGAGCDCVCHDDDAINNGASHYSRSCWCRGTMSSILCTCNELDDDLIEDGWTCYNCYEMDAE
jgi:hypothetical protein